METISLRNAPAGRGWLMALCCLSPLALVALLLPLMSWNSNNVLSLAIALICPVGMILMMFTGRSCHSDSRGDSQRDS